MFMRRHVAALLLILLAWAHESDASDITRGLSVPLSAGIDWGAGISKKFQLYRGSKALIIGINNYTNRWLKLSMAVEDARQVSPGLEKQDFDVTLKLNLTAVELQFALEPFLSSRVRTPTFDCSSGMRVTDIQWEKKDIIPADAPRPVAQSTTKSPVASRTPTKYFAAISTIIFCSARPMSSQ